jgi:hypothetical protein
MPNWCANSVEITHPNPEKLSALVAAMNENKFCNFAIPVPVELSNTISGSFGDAQAQADLEAQTEKNIQQFGYGNWYDFCVKQWGTKWDVEIASTVEQDSNTVYASFDSAWSPPIGVYEALQADGFTVTAYYYEPGMGFVGKWQDGVDEYYELGGEDSTTVRESIGAELDDHFCISEQMAEYEEQEAEQDD